MYSFLPNYYQNENTTEYGPEYWQARTKPFTDVRCVLATDLTTDEFTLFYEEVRSRSEELLRTTNPCFTIPGDDRSISFRANIRMYPVRLIWDEINMLHRWKPREPLIHHIIPYAQSSAHEYLFNLLFGSIYSFSSEIVYMSIR